MNPGDAPFDRNNLEPAAEATDRLAFPDASAVSELPFSEVSYATDDVSYTTPDLLKTLAAVDVSALETATATATGTGEDETTGTGEPTATTTGAGSRTMAGGAAFAALLAAGLLI